MEIIEPHSAHLLLLIDHGRTRQAAQWYQDAFGAQNILARTNVSGVSNGLHIQPICFLQLGPPGIGPIMEIRDSDRAPSTNRTKAIYVLSTNLPDNLIYNVSHAHPPPHIRGQLVEDRQVWDVRDPFGFKWILQTMNVLPAFVINHYPNLMELASVHLVALAHLLLLVPHLRARNASDFYHAAFGTEVLGEEITSFGHGRREGFVIGRIIFLRPGLKRLLWEIKDSIRSLNTPREVSQQLCLFHSPTDQQLVNQALAAGAILVATETDPDFHTRIRKLVDNFGFVWLIGTMDLIPNPPFPFNPQV